MNLSKVTAATLLREWNWRPLSGELECYSSTRSPVTIRLVFEGDEGPSIRLIDRKATDISRGIFPMTEDGLREAVNTAENVSVGN